MQRIFIITVLIGVCFAGCERPPAKTNGEQAEKAHPKEVAHLNGGPNGNWVGSPIGVFGELEVQPAGSFKQPATPEDFVAQVLRAIKEEDHEALIELHFNLRSPHVRTQMNPEELRKYIDRTFAGNRMGLDKEHWGMQRVVLQPMTKPLQANIQNQTEGGKQWIMTPNVTHKIDFEYDWNLSDLRLSSTRRPSGFWVGEEDGTWYICTPQRKP